MSRLVDKYLGEGRQEALEMKKREFEKLGLVFHPKWDDFIKKNKSAIENEVGKINKSTSIIANDKKRNKKFQDEMRDFRSKLIDLWSSMKE